nr:2'-5' RNA ligase family protein [Streptomyces sp. SID5468]
MLQRCRAGFGDPAAHAIPSHITLLPPTEVTPAELPAFREHLAKVAEAGRPFRLRLDGTGTFRPLSPVVFVRLTRGTAECTRLQELVRSGPVARDLQFPYHPHVTIAHGTPEEAMDRAERELARFRAEWTVGGFSLYEQGGDGVWRMMCEYPFGPWPNGGVPQQPGRPTAVAFPHS